jgi:hypothetical protein
MSLKQIVSFIAVAVCMGALSGTLYAQSDDVAEAARQAKAKKQQQAASSSTSAPAKAKTFTNDDFPASGGGASGDGKVVGSSEQPAPGKDTGFVTLTLPNPTVKRPGATPVIWTFKNTSDHWLDLTIMLTVTGPCAFHQEHPIRFRLNNGGGAGDSKTLGVNFYNEDCPGNYTFELKAMSFRQTLSTATTTLKLL